MHEESLYNLIKSILDNKVEYVLIHKDRMLRYGIELRFKIERAKDT
ncbi:MAG: hypothetical protein K5765_02785 [Clostridia bacterium]|nr:hypothetical protein [Clostridia bacterium]